MEIRDAEGEYDLLFPPSPTQPEIKRRRLSISPSRARRQRYTEIEVDPIAQSSQPESSPPFEDHDPLGEVNGTIASPPAHRHPSTPLPASTHTRFNPPSSRNPYPIFSGHPPPSSTKTTANSREAPGPATQASTPLRRPRFILPLTPSRREEDEHTGTETTDPLFSPTLTRYSRTGRTRGLATPEYTAGGMASEVRNWIFDLNARKQASQLPLTQRPRDITQLSESYYRVAEIDGVDTTLQQQVSQSTRAVAPGQVAPKTLITTSKQYPERQPKCHRILLFGGPLLSPLSQSGDGTRDVLTPGNWVGIRRGMVWEMEITGLTGYTDENAKPLHRERETGSEKWLVGIEWDILPPTAVQSQPLPQQQQTHDRI